MRNLPSRRGFTVLEVTVALGILALVLTLVAQLGAWSLGQRRQIEARQVALELAANVLESARALPFESLTPGWAAEQKLPPQLDDVLPRGKLTVGVDTEKSRGRRVSAEVVWYAEDLDVPHTIRLITLLAPRSHAAKGTEP